ncbi:hypothetical protein H6501_02885 [Candidatus Woesearchaeota archaeon]|nr:hypothetical protein [Candidatus Woesearchaeota archaeon]USN43594.1 MAG: hypothetical protein H6500_04330 [Candidatus Woesearchaeota archaeon]
MSLKINTKKIKITLFSTIFFGSIILSLRYFLNRHVLKQGACGLSYPQKCYSQNFSLDLALLLIIIGTLLFYFGYSYYEYKKSKK